MGVAYPPLGPPQVDPPPPWCSLINPPLVDPPLDPPPLPWWINPPPLDPPPSWCLKREPPPLDPPPLEPHESANTGPAPGAKARTLDEASVKKDRRDFVVGTPRVL